MADASEFATTSSGRERVPPIESEVAALESVKDQLDEMIGVRLEDASPEEAKIAYQRARDKHREYMKKARHLKNRFLKQGRRSDSEDCRIDALQATQSLKDLKVSVNTLLEEKEGSLIATSVNSSTQEWVNNLRSEHPADEDQRSVDETPENRFFHTATIHTIDPGTSANNQPSATAGLNNNGSASSGPSGSANQQRSTSITSNGGNISADPTNAQGQGDTEALRAMSRHLLQQDMLRDAIPTFSGDPMRFWSWHSSLMSYLREMQLTPLQSLKLMIRFTEDRPKAYLEGRLLAVGNPSSTDITNILEELTERHGSPHLIAAHLRQRIKDFQGFKDQNDGEALLRLFDLCETIEANMARCPELSDMNYSTGLYPIRAKLPFSIQNLWTKKGYTFYAQNQGRHPPFSDFIKFLREQAKQRSNHHFKLAKEEEKESKATKSTEVKGKASRGARALKTEPQAERKAPSHRYCHLHGRGAHTLPHCADFRKLGDGEKQEFVRQRQLCRRCLEYHQSDGCRTEIRCDTCGRPGHLAAMHYKSMGRHYANGQHDGTNNDRQANVSRGQPNVHNPKCTRLCDEPEGRNCSKTFLVDVTLEGHPDTMRGYVIVDDQSPETLIDESVKDFFQREFPTQEYVMHTACQGLSMHTVGQIISGLSVKGVLKEESIPLPPSFTCKDLADTRDEVATPSTAKRWRHAAPFAHKFPHLDAKAPMVALIGRNCPRAMWDRKVSQAFPYVVESHLGFALVGQTCPEAKHESLSQVRAKKTDSINVQYAFIKPANRYKDVFTQYEDDEEQGLSQNDKEFLSIVTEGVRVDEDGNLELPLPLKGGINPPPVSAYVFKRSESTLNKLKRDPEKLAGCVQNMQRSIDCGYVEQVPIHELDAPNANAMPIHVATHPRKGKHRVVVDPNCNYKGGSLNEALLTGPNLINEMNGVFLRFKENRVAFGADIQDMFCQFRVPKHQRDLLRFFWYKNNDPKQVIVPYRNMSHPFGLSSSPGVANFALKLCAKRPMTKEFEPAQRYLLRAFYVDDGMASANTVEEGIQIVCKAQEILKQNNVRLHKVMSNSRELLEAFPESDRAESSDKSLEEMSQQSVLGVTWDTLRDRISLNVSIPARPFTKRGVLSCIGSIYDRSGLVSPVTLAGRLFQRKIMPPQVNQGETQAYGWDDELPQAYRREYESWLDSLKDLGKISIPRSIGPNNFRPISRQLHVFCDASKDCIGYVAYLRSVGPDGEVCVSFVNACSKVAPRSASSIPRLELNAAVEGAGNAAFLRREMENQPDSLCLYTDSMIVLGYLSNKEKRFSKYVERRVEQVLHHTRISEWSYVHTSQNPADIATRPHSPDELLATAWFSGTQPMWETDYQPAELDPEGIPALPEQKAECTVLKTGKAKTESLTYRLSSRISRYSLILSILKRLNELPHRRDVSKQLSGVTLAPRQSCSLERALTLAVQEAQSDSYGDLLKILKNDGTVPTSHPLAVLSPFLDEHGTIRVGGRLKNANLPLSNKYPVILHCAHPFTALVALSQHQKNKHPGGYLTHAHLRQAGYYLEKGKGFIQRMVRDCVTCKRLRGSPMEQRMADLPIERIEDVAPFVNVGLDVFGHFMVGEGKDTRRNLSYRKVWVLIVVCLPSRAVHLEPLPAMNTSAFMNAFARFSAIRGTCKLVRSDQGSNFLGAINQMEGINVGQLRKEFLIKGIKWIFNPPQASHMGGSWERKIGSVRRIMEATLVTLGSRKLSYDEFATLLAETSSIVNRTPLWATSNDPNDPLPLTPDMILTLRNDGATTKEEYFPEDVLRYGKARYRRVQYLAEQFWTRWRKEYLLTLTERRKWKQLKPCLQVGDVVLIKENLVHRNEWPTGIVMEVSKSADGLVRSATLRMPSEGKTRTMRQITRPISKLVLLVSGGGGK